MFSLTTTELLEYIKEDIPYFDLTTSLQNCKNKKARIEIFTREDVVVSCSEESVKIAEHFNCQVDFFIPSGDKANQNEVILSYEGEYNMVHQAYRLTQILLEYSCKIATYAFNMNRRIKAINPYCELLTTRKTFPFSKKFCIKAAMSGGAMPHRLGLSETILFFNAHRIVYKTNEAFYLYLQELKNHVVEKKIVVESEDIQDSKALMHHGVDVLQLDKLSLESIDKIVEYKNKHFPAVKILVAGGININNVESFVEKKIDGVVTSAVYQAGMANLGSRLTLIE
ncbi:MAG: ModD protein [Candidatus Marinarcus sp.]|uniref:ModD protein n=1 Tax=Candidatus Marinarcus sp. TaxID=3100987 RepID=UPI003AFFAC23